MQQKPTLVNVIAWTTLASGIVNIIWGLAASGMALATILGIICTPITILPTILGIFEILYAAKLLSNPPQVVKPSTNIAVLEIVCVLAGNIFAMVVGILSLVFYNDQIVKDYFDHLNGMAPLAPALTVAAVPPTPAAESEEPMPPTEPTVPAPEPPQNPEDPDIPNPS
jgi:hypothetical protein